MTTPAPAAPLTPLTGRGEFYGKVYGRLYRLGYHSKDGSVAILGDANANQIVPLSWAQRFPALQSGDVDVVIKATGWTMGRDTEVGMQFSIPYFFGGAQLLVRKELDISDATGLD
ncbi:MAG: transporter substrate-binding domain-containing protein, partial [Planctomycetota bacterium]